MKKIAICNSCCGCLVISAIYVFIPKEIKIARSIMRYNETAIQELTNDSNWKNGSPIQLPLPPIRSSRLPFSGQKWS